jgi:hypothetical protein
LRHQGFVFRALRLGDHVLEQRLHSGEAGFHWLTGKTALLDEELQVALGELFAVVGVEHCRPAASLVGDAADDTQLRVHQLGAVRHAAPGLQLTESLDIELVGRLDVGVHPLKVLAADAIPRRARIADFAQIPADGQVL